MGVRLACIDDFAFRKGQRYGSVLVDIETRNVVDILNSREYDDVKRWLDGFPNLEIVSRDGSITYKKAISDAHENAIQISDRFHLLKNLTEYAKGYIKRKIPIHIDLEVTSQQQYEPQELPKIRGKYKYATKWELILATQKMREDGYTVNQISELLGLANRTAMAYCKISPEEKMKYDTISMVKKSKVMENQGLKASTIQLIQDMIADGYSNQKISEAIGKSERTVRRYLKADPTGRHGKTGTKHRQKLDPYKEQVLALSAKGQSSTKILSNIRNSGYTGSASSIREFLRKQSIEAATEGNRSHITICRIERPSLIALLYKDISKVREISDDHYLRIIGLFPELGAVLQLLKTFKSVLMAGKPNDLDAWIEAARGLDISELNSFLTGVGRDLEAIKNAILFPYSNGLAEGTVNKIKVIKRIMYGRCGFHLLRRKVLLNNIN